jgi:hypothetical protein
MVMENQNTFFSTVAKHKLGQEEHASLNQYDYAIAMEVSDCMIVVVRYQPDEGRDEERIGHFGAKDLVQPSASYLGFRAYFEGKNVLEIKYATNYQYNSNILRHIAQALSRGTYLRPEDVQSYMVPQDSFLSYRPIVYFAYSGAFRTAGCQNDATNPNLHTNLIDIPFPKPLSLCTLL